MMEIFSENSLWLKLHEEFDRILNTSLAKHETDVKAWNIKS